MKFSTIADGMGFDVGKLKGSVAPTTTKNVTCLSLAKLLRAEKITHVGYADPLSPHTHTSASLLFLLAHKFILSQPAHEMTACLVPLNASVHSLDRPHSHTRSLPSRPPASLAVT
jgi:hypothetical protein